MPSPPPHPDPAAPTATPAVGRHHPSGATIEAAAEHLRRGRLVAFPTETVYGLGADASNPEAVSRIFAAKGRPADHPLIVHLARADQVDDWAVDVPDAARRLAEHFWPGPLTLILRKRPEVPDAVTGGQPTVGLRVPSHPVAHALLAAFGGGIAAPSANRFGRVSPTTRARVLAELGDRVDVVLEGGASEVGIESTIVDLSGDRPRLLRPGGIGAAEIARVLGQGPTREGTGAPRTPGRLASHYAPATPVRVVEPAVLEDVVREHTAAGRRVVVLAPGHVAAGPGVVVVPVPGAPAAYAHDLYAHLAGIDDLAADVVLVQRPPVATGWEAVHDRLGRAEGTDPHTPRVLTVAPAGMAADDVSSRTVALLAGLGAVVDLGTWTGTGDRSPAGAGPSGTGSEDLGPTRRAPGRTTRVLPGADRAVHVEVRSDGTVSVLVVEASDANGGIPVGRHELVDALEAAGGP